MEGDEVKEGWNVPGYLITKSVNSSKVSISNDGLSPERF